jgi:hypothetical protein
MEPDEKDKKKAAPRKLFTDLEQRKPVVVRVAMPKRKMAKDLDAPKPAAAPRKRVLFTDLDQAAPVATPVKRKPKLIENR